MTDRKIRILIADDHPLMIEGIRAVIESQPDMEVVAEAADGLEALTLYRTHLPDVALIDLQMPRMNGIDAIHLIRNEFPTARIGILTTYRGDVRASHAIKAGAQAYLLKTALRTELTEAVRVLAVGKRYFPTAIAADLADHLGKEHLTPRELEILGLIAGGLSNKEIADHLGLAEDTIKGHVRSLMDKLSARNRTHAVAIAVERGFVTP
ncbi:MAG: response regulator transcription factor [Oxalicibacterium faecigallinarum]|uniref:DNA-binding response regulator n=1 Tax=Oxalicibacterium faecigallinarum TaxID=573741 RepID=A0A8J3ANJ0_9BURK|nr:response regulator transcription factor [Oxalicibacterium faecigallinarum]MDQ7969970.1 response regulator transcription factor [Oxalicibacterium faecigallinarum]GGI17818.1 DNA-binding response regulator [Oxalicibacterium faecigallinarum]